MVQVGLQIAVLLWATRKLAQPPITLRTDDAFHKHIHDYTCDCCMICLADNYFLHCMFAMDHWRIIIIEY